MRKNNQQKLHFEWSQEQKLTPQEETYLVTANRQRCHLTTSAEDEERLLLAQNSSANGSPPKPANEKPPHLVPSASSNENYVYNSPSQVHKRAFPSYFSGVGDGVLLD